VHVAYLLNLTPTPLVPASLDYSTTTRRLLFYELLHWGQGVWLVSRGVPRLVSWVGGFIGMK